MKEQLELYTLKTNVKAPPLYNRKDFKYAILHDIPDRPSKFYADYDGAIVIIIKQADFNNKVIIQTQDNKRFMADVKALEYIDKETGELLYG